MEKQQMFQLQREQEETGVDINQFINMSLKSNLYIKPKEIMITQHLMDFNM